MKCKVKFGDKIVNAKLLSLDKDRATVIVEGYECSDSVPISDVIIDIKRDYYEIEKEAKDRS